jgi:hypothetical protein
MQITPNRNVNRYDVPANEGMKSTILNNGTTALDHQKGSI